MSELNFFDNKKICVFGGTGTLGSLIVEYLITQNPSVIRIFNLSEHSSVKKRQKWGYGEKNNIRYLIGDIRNYERCKLALKDIDYVFNCAAIKHVDVAEYNPMVAITTNVNGLKNIINACIEQKVKKLLQISTDKACEPTSLMGATKMLGERLIQIRWSQNPEVDMICVRLGNILNSRGSILPKVRKQKAKGKPITITNPDMERFFMTQKEAIKFIINAFINGKNGEIWVPKLKETNLMDLIEKEIGKCSIEIIGNRKGEKLRERMISDHEIMIADCTKRDMWIIRNKEWS